MKKKSIYVSKKCCEDKNSDLLLIGEGEKKFYVLVKDFNTFMYSSMITHNIVEEDIFVVLFTSF